MSSIDQQFVEYIVRSLVSKPDAVKVERRIDEKGVLLELTVDPEDLGRVIGKRGATAQSIRSLLRALGTKNDARYNLKIVDNGVPRPERTEYKKQDEPAKAEEPAAEAETPAEETTEEVEEPVEEEAAGDEPEPEAAEEDDNNSFANKTRKGLEDLDDLDV